MKQPGPAWRAVGDPDGDRDRDSDCATTYPPTQLWRGLRRGGCRYVTPWDRGEGPQTQGDTGLSVTGGVVASLVSPRGNPRGPQCPLLGKACGMALLGWHWWGGTSGAEGQG